MAKKLFMNRESYLYCHVPTVSREEPDSEVAFSSINSPVLQKTEQLSFLILDETSKSFPKFYATGRIS